MVNTFYFQAQELRSYLKSLSADISEEKAEAGILTDLRHIIEASNICWNSKDVNDNGMPLIYFLSMTLLNLRWFSA